MRETGGRGADVVFEAAGAGESVLLLPRLCRVKGRIVMVAIPKDPREMDIVGLTFKELTVTGVRVPRTIGLPWQILGSIVIRSFMGYLTDQQRARGCGLRLISPTDCTSSGVRCRRCSAHPKQHRAMPPAP